VSLIGRFKCLFGRHERSRREAVRYMDNSVLGACKHCGKAMFRHPREGWQVERRSQQRCFDRAGESSDAPPASKPDEPRDG
jgi:hypothetical protein